jgi:hypothetical protein
VSILEDLKVLEERLLDPVVRCSPELVDALLADDFTEFGSSGRVYDKTAIIQALKHETGFEKYIARDFTVKELAPTVSLVTYKIDESATLRSSIWRLDEGQWKMVFHQGTRINPAT